MKQLFLPRYTIGKDAYDAIPGIVSGYGKKLALIHGERAYNASKHKLLPALEGFEIVYEGVYGKEASWENILPLTENEDVKKADAILAIGGGKAIDVSKVVGDRLGIPVFSVATIASTCAAVTKISILHNPDGSFREILKLKEPPVHCFIDSEIIAASPAEYFWAGMGDAMAKHVECNFSAKNDVLDFASEYGRLVSELCFKPMIEHGAAAYEAVKRHENSDAVEQVILSIIVATGSVSVAVHPDYNSAVAHALYYGLTVREWMERKHLHGEIVSYGTLIQLIVDEQWENLEKVFRFNRSVGLPTRLADLGLERDDELDDVLDATVVNQELDHVPFKVTKEMLKRAILDLEDYNDEYTGE